MQLGVEFVDLTAVSIPVELASYVPKNIVKKFCVVPVKLVKDTLYLAMSDPLDFAAQEEVKVASRKRVIPMIATRRTTEHDISLLYGSEGTAGVIEEMKREAGSSTPDIVPVQVSQKAMDSGDSAPTIRFVSSLIERAFSERASDIHLEPQDGEMVVRMRIDGLLRRVLTVPSELQSTVISRLKIMGGMNIAEHIAASLTLRGWSPPTICVELTKTDEGYTLKKSEHCCAVWKKKRLCENCISQEVLRTHKPQTKIETRASDIYYVLASFIEVDGRPYSLELVKRIKSDDELVRYGGDEFFLLFRDLPQQILEKKLQSIRAALDEIVIEKYPELHISASIGGAFAAGRISRTIRRADLAMYQAKRKKDCVAIYREEKEHET